MNLRLWEVLKDGCVRYLLIVLWRRFVRTSFFSSVADVEVEKEDMTPSVLEKLTSMELLQIIQQLPEGFRTIFNLFAIEGFSHKEIGEMLHITEGTSRSQYARARQRLQEIIKRMYSYG